MIFQIWPLIVKLSALTWLFASFAAAEDWNQWRGPQRTGVSTSQVPLLESLPATGLQPVWRSEDRLEGGGNGGWSSPIVAEGRVYGFSHRRISKEGVKLPPETYPPLDEKKRESMSKEDVADYDGKRNVEQKDRRDQQFRYQETILCLDAKTGERLWKFDRDSAATNFGQSGTPAVYQGRLYFLGADRKAICLNAATGEEIWSTQAATKSDDEQISSSVALADGVIVVLAGDLVGLDAMDGRRLWTGPSSRMTGKDSSPIVWRSGDRDYVLANVNGSDTVCLIPRSGEEVWRIASHGGRSTPVVSGNRMVTLGDNRKNGLRCFALSENGAELEWTYQGLSDPGSSPVIVGDHVYVQGENRLACVELSSGKPAWRTTLDLAQPRYTSLVAADGKVFYVFDGLLAFAAVPEEFRTLIAGKFDEKGVLLSEESLRQRLKIAEMEKAENGQEEAQKVWQREVTRHGPLNCSSPALVDGFLYLRRQHDLVCYDLTQRGVSALGQAAQTR